MTSWNNRANLFDTTKTHPGAFMILIGRMLATISALVLVSLFVFVGLATLQYNSILSKLTQERLEVLVDTVRAPFQAVADLGVPIGTMRNAEAVLERARLSDDAIVAIHVISAEGQLARSTQSETDNEVAGDILRVAKSAGPGERWSLETHNRFLVGANISGIAGEDAGIIYIEYSKRDTQVQVQAMEARLALLAGAVFIVAGVVIFIILRLVLSEHVRIFSGIQNSYHQFERMFWRRGEGHPDTAQDIVGLGFSTVEFRRLMDRSEVQYEAAQEQAQGTPE